MHTREFTLIPTDTPYPAQVDLDALDFEGPHDDGRILECKTNVTRSQLESILWQIHGQMLLTGIPKATLIALTTGGGGPTITDHTVDLAISHWLNAALTVWDAALTRGAATPPPAAKIPWHLGFTDTGIILTPKEA